MAILSGPRESVLDGAVNAAFSTGAAVVLGGVISVVSSASYAAGEGVAADERDIIGAGVVSVLHTLGCCFSSAAFIDDR